MAVNETAQPAHPASRFEANLREFEHVDPEQTDFDTRSIETGLRAASTGLQAP